MIPRSFLDARRAAGDSDGEIIAAWEVLEAQAAAWLTAAEVARRVGRSRQAVSMWCLHGKFGPGGAIKLDGVWRVNPGALAKFTPPDPRGGRPKQRRESHGTGSKT